MTFAAIMAGALALSFQDASHRPLRVQSCEELETLDNTSQLYEIAGTYRSDGLHPYVNLLNCTGSRVFVNWSDLPAPLDALPSRPSEITAVWTSQQIFWAVVYSGYARRPLTHC
jgi:hypothetical protein